MKKILLVLLLMVFTSLCTYSVEKTYSGFNFEKGKVVFVPYGVTTNLVLNSSVSSMTSSLGDSVNATFNHDFSYNGVLIAPTGSIMEGNIVDIKRPSRKNKNGMLMIKFNSIVTPQNFNIPISAVIKTSDNKGILTGAQYSDKNFEIVSSVNENKIPSINLYYSKNKKPIDVLEDKESKKTEIEPVCLQAGSVIEVYFNQPITSSPNIYKY